MKQRLLDAAKIICATTALTFATSAMAEPLRMAQAQPGVLPPHEIVTILRSTGLDPLDRPVRRGPTYVLRATDEGGEEVRVVVDAHGGEVLSVTPLATASRGPLPGGTHMGPYEPMDPGYISPNYAPSGPPGFYGAGPPVYESDEPIIYGTRPPVPVPGALQRAQGGPPPGVAAVPPGEPHVIMAPDNSETGMLPPPPERFPQRAAPPVTKKPVKRAASATPPRSVPPKSVPPKSVSSKPVKPKVAPLPKPRPGAVTSAPAPAATPPQNKPAVDAVPN